MYKDKSDALLDPMGEIFKFKYPQTKAWRKYPQWVVLCNECVPKDKAHFEPLEQGALEEFYVTCEKCGKHIS